MIKLIESWLRNLLFWWMLKRIDSLENLYTFFWTFWKPTWIHFGKIFRNAEKSRQNIFHCGPISRIEKWPAIRAFLHWIGPKNVWEIPAKNADLHCVCIFIHFRPTKKCVSCALCSIRKQIMPGKVESFAYNIF